MRRTLTNALTQVRSLLEPPVVMRLRTFEAEKQRAYEAGRRRRLKQPMVDRRIRSYATGEVLHQDAVSYRYSAFAADGHP